MTVGTKKLNLLKLKDRRHHQRAEMGRRQHLSVGSSLLTGFPKVEPTKTAMDSSFLSDLVSDTVRKDVVAIG